MSDAPRQRPPVDIDGLTLDRLRRRRSHKWASVTADELPAFVADMDMAPLDAVTAAVRAYADAGDLGYGDGIEEDDLRTSYRQWSQRRHGWAPQPERVVVTPNVMRAITAALEVSTRPGDGVVVQPPVYPPFFDVVTRGGRHVVENPLRRGPSGYEMDLEHLRAVAPRARALLLCSPQNPTGRVWRVDELSALADVAEEHGLLVIADEIHQDLLGATARHVPFASLDHPAATRAVVTTSASKSFSIAGLGCAVAVLPTAGDAERLDHAVASHFAHPPVVSIRATTAAWRHGDAWLDAVLEHLGANHELLTRRFEAFPRLVHLPPEGTYLHWLDVSRLDLGASPADEIRRRSGVVLTDGAAFGTGGAGHVRLNAATPRPVLEQVLDRLATVFGS